MAEIIIEASLIPPDLLEYFEPIDPDARTDVFKVATRPFKGAHFATFPPKLIEPCILAGCPAGGTVLDPFSGAGTTGVVAVEHGRSYLGIEINPEYLAMSGDRINAAQTEATPLFA